MPSSVLAYSRACAPRILLLLLLLLLHPPPPPLPQDSRGDRARERASLLFRVGQRAVPTWVPRRGKPRVSGNADFIRGFALRLSSAQLGSTRLGSALAP
jgi:hypothetical protein